MRWGKETLNGYWRNPTVGPPAIAHEQPMKTPTLEEGTLAAELQSVTQLGLQKIGQILRLPTDPHNGNVLRAQTTAAATAVNAQLRADETKMKQQQREDVLQELIKRMKEEKAKLAELGIEPFGFKRDEHGGTP
jgi:acyl-CoA reductase-like NAD-dependent aldehyde dehydrogenase